VVHGESAVRLALVTSAFVGFPEGALVPSGVPSKSFVGLCSPVSKALGPSLDGGFHQPVQRPLREMT